MNAEDKHWANLAAWSKGLPDPFPETEVPVISGESIIARLSSQENAEAVKRLPESIRSHPLFKQPQQPAPESGTLREETTTDAALALSCAFLSAFSCNEESFVIRKATGEPDERGKRPAPYVTVERPFAEADIAKHFRGVGCIVGKPDRGGTCLCAAIDIDVYGRSHSSIENRITELHLPLVSSESKSGGIHAWAFFSEAVPCAYARELLGGYALVLGHPLAEIFPKKVTPGKKPYGIALPFFGEPERFREFINKPRVYAPAPPADWKPHEEKPPKESASSGTPSGLREGNRRPTLFKVACKMRREGLDEDSIYQAIKAVPCSPPLPDSELRKLAHGTTRYDSEAGFAQTKETSAEVLLCYYEDVEREQVRWLWPSRIPRGKLTLFVGNPGTGKSLATIDLAARVSTGRAFPDGEPSEPGDVLILTAEDDAADTVAPRLDAAGADSSRIARINSVKVTLADGAIGQSVFNLERDLAKLEEALGKHPGRFKLIIIDPLSAYLGTKVNSWRDAEVRSLLTPLTEFAMRTGIAVVGILHMRKSEADAMLRVSGSIAFVAAARAVWGFGPDPDNPASSIMVGVKNNLAPLGNALGFRIVATTVNDAPHIVWETKARNVDAEDVLGGNKKEKRDRAEKVAEAEEWLRDQLATMPLPEKQLTADAAKHGIAGRTLWRAKKRLNIESHKDGMTGPWYWELPASATKSN
jgi:putative DNA primase/helicase